MRPLKTSPVKKRATPFNAEFAVTVAVLSATGLLPQNADADTFYSATDSAIVADHLLRDAALQQQTHTPLVRMPRYSGGGRDAVADPDAIYVQYDKGDLEHTGVASEADIEIRQPLLLTGGEYQVSPQWLIGANVGRLEQTLQFADSNDCIDTKADLASFYAQWGKNGFTATGLAGYQQGELESARALAGGGNAQGEADTRQHVFSLAGRYAFEDGGWRYGPFSRMDLSRGDIDAHSIIAEGTRTDWQHRMGETRVFTMGVHGTYLFDANAGTLAPYFTLATRKEFHSKRDPLNGVEWLGDTSTGVTVSASPQDERWHEATVGLRIALAKQLLINGEFAQALDLQHEDRQSLSIRADWIFQGP